MRIGIHGAAGRMGRVLSDTIIGQGDHEIGFGVDKNTEVDFPYPVFKSLDDVDVNVQVVIDFSYHEAVKDLLGWCLLRDMPVVISTTNLGAEEHRIIQEAARQIPVFLSPNMSLGISALCKGLPIIASTLDKSFDWGIFEIHHRNKKDAPSGTAHLLKETIDGKCSGISALRIGSVPGEHKVIFAGPDEVLEISHTAYSPKIFALGAIKAASFIADKKSGLYNMEDL